MITNDQLAIQITQLMQVTQIIINITIMTQMMNIVTNKQYVKEIIQIIQITRIMINNMTALPSTLIKEKLHLLFILVVWWPSAW
jgi:hypothetical protein